MIIPIKVQLLILLNEVLNVILWLPISKSRTSTTSAPFHWLRPE